MKRDLGTRDPSALLEVIKGAEKRVPWANSTIPALAPASASPSRNARSLRPAGDGLGHAPGYGLAAVIGKRLAGAELVDVDRGMELHHHLHPAQPGEMPEMGGQLHIAIPGQQGPERAAEGKPVQL